MFTVAMHLVLGASAPHVAVRRLGHYLATQCLVRTNDAWARAFMWLRQVRQMLGAFRADFARSRRWSKLWRRLWEDEAQPYSLMALPVYLQNVLLNGLEAPKSLFPGFVASWSIIARMQFSYIFIKIARDRTSSVLRTGSPQTMLLPNSLVTYKLWRICSRKKMGCL